MSGPDHASSGSKSGPDGTEGSRLGDTELSARLERLNTSLGQVRAKAEVAAPRVRIPVQVGRRACLPAGCRIRVGRAGGIPHRLRHRPPLLDHALGLIVFTLVGFGAGVANMLRASGEGRKKGLGKS